MVLFSGDGHSILFFLHLLYDYWIIGVTNVYRMLY